MIQQDYLNLIAQTEDGQIFNQGVQQSGNNVIAINRQAGLLILGHSTIAGNESSSRKAVEILLDDMALNFHSADNTEITVPSGSVALQSLRESFDNINEYLHHLGGKTATLAALQFTWKQVSCASAGNMCNLMFSKGQLHELVPDRSSAADQLPQLGLSAKIDTDLSEQNLSPGDLLLMTTADVLRSVGKDHIRLTLSRFQDNLDIALRQINTRASRSGMEKKPVLILVRVEQSTPSPKNWLDKIRRRQ